jgi:hypothetical protein
MEMINLALAFLNLELVRAYLVVLEQKEALKTVT